MLRLRHRQAHAAVKTFPRAVRAATSLIAAVTLLILSACTGGTPTPIVKSVEVTATPTFTPRPSSTSTPAPTSTPTSTPKPTYTPRPTFTRFPTSTPAPAPVLYSGTGNDVLRIEKPEEGHACYMHIEGNASSDYFGVTAYDKNGQLLEIYVNTTKLYNGTRLLDLYDGDETAMLEIEAEGPWQIVLLPFDEYSSRRWLIPPDVAREKGLPSTRFPSDMSGSGDEVLILLQGASIVKGTHEGNGNFIVIAYGKERRTVFNEIGTYSGKAVLPADTVILELLTEGEWTIEIE